MAKKPPYEELAQRVKELEREALQGKRAEEELKRLLRSSIHYEIQFFPRFV